MNKRITHLLKTFKPEFGNPNHIRALKILDLIRKKDDLIAKKREDGKKVRVQLEEIKEELSNDERSLLFLLKPSK